MGLAIAKGLLAVQHGHINAANRPEGGVCFTLVVPAEVQ